MHRLPELLELIYEAASDQQYWSEAADAIRQATHADLVFLQMRPQPWEIVVLATNIPGSAVQAASEWAISDPFYLAGLRREPGIGYLDQELVAAPVLQRSEFYNECMVGLLASRHFMGSHTSTRLGALGMFGGTDLSAFTLEDRDVLTTITRHLGRSLTLQNALVHARLESAAGYDALDALPTAVLITTAEGHVKFANAAAEALIDRGDGLSIVGRGLKRTIRALASDVDKALRAAMHQAREVLTDNAKSYVRIPRRLDQSPYMAFVSSLPRRMREPWLGAESLCLVLVRDPDATPPDLSRAAQQLFGLTPSEARLAVALTRGATLQEIAEVNAISVSTVRSQLRQVLLKTGCKRQADVVRALLTLR